METIRTAANLRRWRAVAPGPVGLVPTMGALHAGHMALVRRARAACESVVVSIFVNPLQFGPHEDYLTYPRDEARDLAALEAEGVDAAFVPPVEEVFPPDFETCVEVTRLGTLLEGAARPGHFRGVATVVARLFGLARPDRAYFGWKDAQQVLVVRRMAADLALGVEIVPVETVREADGLAMSSRNVYLSPADRAAAPALYAALRAAAEALAAGEGSTAHEMLRARLEGTPLALEYAKVIEDPWGGPPRLVAAARIGRVRLLDEVPIIAGTGRSPGEGPPPHRPERRRRPRRGAGGAGLP